MLRLILLFLGCRSDSSVSTRLSLNNNNCNKTFKLRPLGIAKADFTVCEARA